MRRNQFTLSLALVALLCPVFVHWIEAQKTIARTTNNSYRQVLTGSQPNAVYGGYQATGGSSLLSTNKRRQQTILTAPVNQQRFESQSSYAVEQQPAPFQQAISSSSSYEEQQQSAEADAEPASYGSVAGQPGRDFPAYTRVPKTSFSCEGLPYEYGMYADEETGCQAYHVCYNGRKDSFLCGVGTVFNQRILHCDYWYAVECGKSSQYYGSNAFMGSSQPEPGPAQAGVLPPAQQQQSVSTYRRTESSVRAPVYQRLPGQSSAVSSWSSSRNVQQQQIQEDGLSA